MRAAVVWQTGLFLVGVGVGGNLISQMAGVGKTRTQVARFWDEARRRSGPLVRSAVDQALWEARGWRVMAGQAANGERERLDAWDPEALTGAQWEEWRLQTLARDPHGHLQRARAALIRAAAAARCCEETVRVMTLRALVEHEAGDHREQLQQARALAKLAPRGDVTEITLCRAAACNGCADEARRADSTCWPAHERWASGANGSTTRQYRIAQRGGRVACLVQTT
jgi:hypothetical protein